MATAAINAGDTNTALLAFTKYLELDPEVARRPTRSKLDQAEHAEVHVDALSIADQVRGPVS